MMIHEISHRTNKELTRPKTKYLIFLVIYHNIYFLSPKIICYKHLDCLQFKTMRMFSIFTRFYFEMSGSMKCVL